MSQTLAAYLHDLSVLLMLSFLLLEYWLFHRPLSLLRARWLIVADLSYNTCVSLVVASGLVQAIWFAKGIDFYLHNSLFYGKLILLILLSTCSLLPTLTFLNWRHQLQARVTPTLAPQRRRLVALCLHLEVLLLSLLCLLGFLLSRGIGAL